MLVFDTESDGFLEEATKLHVINLIDRSTGAREAYHDHPQVSTTNRVGSLAEGVVRLQAEVDSGGTIAGHNVIRHDIPLIQKFFPDFTVHPDRVLDTLIVSRLIWTDLYEIDQRAIRKRRRPPEFLAKGMSGLHSLEAWGYRLGTFKGDYDGTWEVFTPEMAVYGIQDPETTLALVEKIEAENYSEEAIRLEHRVAEIVFLQELYGFRFDIPAAEKLQVELIGEMAELEDQLRDIFPPWYVAERYKGQPVVVDPKRRRSAKADADGRTIKSEYEPGCPYSKVKLVSFEPGSRDMIADRLVKVFGWVPQEFSEKTGKPTVDEETLGGLVMPEAKMLIRYLTVSKLLGTVAAGKKAWLKKVGPDGRIHSKVNSNGAITGRMTHADHMAQVPRIKHDDAGNPLKGYAGKYGYEARSLFIAGEGRVLVGVDADGLEGRMQGHYQARFDDGAFARSVVDGDKKAGTDNHSINRDLVGLRTRDGGKTWYYAMVYGAGDPKLGIIQYEDMSETWQDAFNRKNPPGPDRERAFARLGRRGRNKIEAGLLGFDKLLSQVKVVARNDKQFRGLDGRWLKVRGIHSALNTLFQSAGAIVMKRALVITYDVLLERGWKHGREFAFVANIHDEFQMEVLPELSEEVGQIAADAIRRAGESFELRCPLAGSAAIGSSWAATH